MLTVKQAAPRMRVGINTIYGLCAAKLLRHVRIGLGRGKLLIPEDAIEEYLKAHTIGVQGEKAVNPSFTPTPRLKHSSSAAKFPAKDRTPSVVGEPCSR